MTASTRPLSAPQPTALPDVWTVDSVERRDDRGAFARLFDRDLLGPLHGDRPIVQVNRSITRAVGALRGLHFQIAPHLEAKWVRCLHGRVWDVAVDLRQDSPTFLQHAAVELSAERMNAVFLPEGFAHGFQVLEADSELLYLHSAPYVPSAEDGVRWDDPALAITWPLPPTDISVRDREHPLLSASYEGLAV
ncbi:MAG: dTDP-4-dehydrorhamnose 3,5-epimerase family protein [Croceibacterium sp.]